MGREKRNRSCNWALRSRTHPLHVPRNNACVLEPTSRRPQVNNLNQEAIAQVELCALHLLAVPLLLEHTDTHSTAPISALPACTPPAQLGLAHSPTSAHAQCQSAVRRLGRCGNGMLALRPHRTRPLLVRPLPTQTLISMRMHMRALRPAHRTRRK
ncbi:hypothetical protein B0H13DRAFT_1960991 [Mycena leptocephala]|nr:hypothetical protein B0H13DRAFT_1960991 [Mycena leptocephala]